MLLIIHMKTMRTVMMKSKAYLANEDTKNSESI